MCKNAKTIYFDCGNSQNKILFEDRKIVTTSNIEVVEDSNVFNSWTVNEVSFINSEIAKAKKITNKICKSRKLLIGKNLFDLVEDKEKVRLVTFLPISQYINPNNKVKMSEMLNGKYKVVSANGEVKNFTVTDTMVLAEEFVALLTNPKLLQKETFVVGIGGVDTSIFRVKNGIPDTNKIHTSESAINWYYDSLGRVVTSHLNQSFSLSDAKLLLAKYDELDEELKTIIDNHTMKYIEKNVIEPLKELGYRNIIHSNVVVLGGGSLDLKRWFDKLGYFDFLEDSLFANVLGARIYDQQLAIKKGGK